MSRNTGMLKKIGKNIAEFWRKVFSIFRWDMKKIFTNPIAAVIAAGLMILPSILCLVQYREASWDPYGNTGNLTVAVANCDDGYSLKGIQVNMETPSWIPWRAMTASDGAL